MKNKNLWRIVSSSALALVLAVMLFGVNLIIGLNLGMFRNRTIEDAVRDSKFYDESYERLQGEINHMLSDTEIPPEIVFEVVSLKHFYIDTRTYLQKLLASNSSNVEKTAAIQVEEIEAALVQYYEGTGVGINIEGKESIKVLAASVLEIYKEQMDFGLGESIVEYRSTFMKLSAIVVVATLTLGGIAFLAIYKMYNKLYSALGFVAVSVVGASVMILVFTFLVSSRVDYTTLFQQSAYYQNFIDRYVSESVKALLYPAGIGVIVCSVLILMIKELRLRAIKQAY